jgi:uncharacterized protein (DUF1778 family)
MKAESDFSAHWIDPMTCRGLEILCQEKECFCRKERAINAKKIGRGAGFLSTPSDTRYGGLLSLPPFKKNSSFQEKNMSKPKMTKPIYVRVSPEEKSCLEELAALANLSLSRFLAVSALGAETPSKEVLLRWDLALFQLRRTDVTLREIKKVLRKQKGWALYERVASTLDELDAALKGLGSAWSGK